MNPKAQLKDRNRLLNILFFLALVIFMVIAVYVHVYPENTFDSQLCKKITRFFLLLAAVYPNPATDKFNVYFSSVSDEPASVELYSQDGKLLYSNSNVQSNGMVSIPASGYNTGLYVVKLKQGTKLKTFKALKQ